jgi:hypothetical protein
MTDLLIRNIDEREAEMFNNIHRSIRMNIKGAIRINLSGNPNDFKYVYLEIEPDNATKIIKYESLNSEKKLP